MLTPTVQEVPITREGLRVDPAVIALQARWAEVQSQPAVSFLATANVDLRSDR